MYILLSCDRLLLFINTVTTHFYGLAFINDIQCKRNDDATINYLKATLNLNWLIIQFKMCEVYRFYINDIVEYFQYRLSVGTFTLKKNNYIDILYYVMYRNLDVPAILVRYQDIILKVIPKMQLRR